MKGKEIRRWEAMDKYQQLVKERSILSAKSYLTYQ